MKTDSFHIDFETSIGPWLGKTVKLVDYRMHEAFNSAKLDLTKEQMLVLKKLYEKGGLNQNELACLTYRDKSSLARLLSTMESKGYITRRKNEKDRRINDVFITETGQNVYKNSQPVIKKLINTMENGITQDEKKQIIAILKKIQANFTE